LSIDNAVLGQLPKRLLFTMIKNNVFLVSLYTNTLYFRHFDLSHFTLFYNGNPIPIEGLPMYMDHDKRYILAYNTLFEVSCMRQSIAWLQLTRYVHSRPFHAPVRSDT